MQTGLNTVPSRLTFFSSFFSSIEGVVAEVEAKTEGEADEVVVVSDAASVIAVVVETVHERSVEIEVENEETGVEIENVRNLLRKTRIIKREKCHLLKKVGIVFIFLNSTIFLTI